MCSKKHMWMAIPKSVKRGHWCFLVLFVFYKPSQLVMEGEDLEKLEQMGNICIEVRIFQWGGAVHIDMNHVVKFLGKRNNKNDIINY